MTRSSVTRRQRGSVLMLMPAGVLVVLLLGAISFDLSLVYVRQRQAAGLAVDLANDLASAALDEAHLRATGAYLLDQDRADAIGAELADRSDLADHLDGLVVEVVGPDTVRVVLTVRVEYVFARAIPGASDGTTVTAQATAVSQVGSPG